MRDDMTPEATILKGASTLLDASYYDELDDMKRAHLRDMARRTKAALDAIAAERKASDARLSVSTLGLSGRTTWALIRNNILTLGDMQKSFPRLCRLPGIGEKAREEIAGALKETP